MQNVMPNIGLDSFIDDLSSVGSKGLNHQDCKVLFHAGMKRTVQQPDSSQQQQQCNQPQAARQSTRRESEKERGERGRREKVIRRIPNRRGRVRDDSRENIEEKRKAKQLRSQ